MGFVLYLLIFFPKLSEIVRNCPKLSKIVRILTNKIAIYPQKIHFLYFKNEICIFWGSFYNIIILLSYFVLFF